MHQKNIVAAGKNIAEAEKVLIMIHGRGADAYDILGVADHLNVKDFALIAPQATNNTWYPYPFIVPPQQNEPWLSSALGLLFELTDNFHQNGIDAKNIYFLGFSQGACLTLEFTARNAKRYGGIVAFTGGLIGDKIYAENYEGDFNGTPVFIASSDPDPHIPTQRVHDSSKIFRKMNANVTEKIYPNMGHMIIKEEINLVNEIIFL